MEVLAAVLNIGAIYAFIPIIIIIILIAAAAGLTRGKDLFALFGLGALIGFGGAAGRGAGKGISKGPRMPKSTLDAARGAGGITSLGASGAKNAKTAMKGGMNKGKADAVRKLAKEGEENKRAGNAVTPLQQKAMDAVAATNASAAGIAYRQANAGKTAVDAPKVGKAYKQANAGRINLVVSSAYNIPRTARQSGGGRRFGDITSKSPLKPKGTARYKVEAGIPRFTVRPNILVGLGLAGAARLADMATEEGRRRRAQEKLYYGVEKDVRKASKKYDSQLLRTFNESISSKESEEFGSHVKSSTGSAAVLHGWEEHIKGVRESANKAWSNMSPEKQKQYEEFRPPGGWHSFIPLSHVRSKRLRELIETGEKPPGPGPGP